MKWDTNAEQNTVTVNKQTYMFNIWPEAKKDAWESTVKGKDYDKPNN